LDSKNKPETIIGWAESSQALSKYFAKLLFSQSNNSSGVRQPLSRLLEIAAIFFCVYESRLNHNRLLKSQARARHAEVKQKRQQPKTSF
jgi:hypothetical protein